MGLKSRENGNETYPIFTPCVLASTILAAKVVTMTTENRAIDVVFDIVSSLAVAAIPPNHAFCRSEVGYLSIFLA